eukprot:3529157-Rhodomonas_salina.1
MMIQSIRTIIGNSFWGLNKNATLFYGLTSTITDFLSHEQKALRKAKGCNAPENQLEQSVLTLSTFSLQFAGCSEETINANKARVLTELRVMGAWHYALFVPALRDSVEAVTGICASDQASVVQAIQAFALRMLDDPAFAKLLITEHAAPVTYKNTDCSPIQGPL